jgi:hypothetical protein
LRSARRLYRLHVAIAGAGAAIVLAAGAAVVIRSNPAIPSSADIAQACGDWLSGGGAAALLGFAIVGLVGVVAGLALRSVWRQLGGARRYLRSLPPGERRVLQGTPCELIELDEPLACSAGYLRPRIYVSTGAVESLTPAELRAVLAHERHHAERRDPLRRLVARALADSLFFVPILGRISERYAALGELAADEAAVAAVGERRSLASALLKFSDGSALPAPVSGIAPERVDHLVGEPGSLSWRLPISMMGRSLVALASLAALVLLIWHGVINPTLQLPFLLAATCMVLMVGAPALLASWALLVSMRAVRGRRSVKARL